MAPEMETPKSGPRKEKETGQIPKPRESSSPQGQRDGPDHLVQGHASVTPIDSEPFPNPRFSQPCHSPVTQPKVSVLCRRQRQRLRPPWPRGPSGEGLLSAPKPLNPITLNPKPWRFMRFCLQKGVRLFEEFGVYSLQGSFF